MGKHNAPVDLIYALQLDDPVLELSGTPIYPINPPKKGEIPLVIGRKSIVLQKHVPLSLFNGRRLIEFYS